MSVIIEISVTDHDNYDPVANTFIYTDWETLNQYDWRDDTDEALKQLVTDFRKGGKHGSE